MSTTPSPWIVEPEEIRIELTVPGTDGVARPLWLSVRKRLSEGEKRKMAASVSTISTPLKKLPTDPTPNSEAKYAWADYSFARMVAFVVDWSIAHEADPTWRLTPCRASYEKLDSVVFEAIDNALDAHETAMNNEKKARSGAQQPPKISSSSAGSDSEA